MSEQLHEIMAQIAILHQELIDNDKIKDADEVFEFLEDYDTDLSEHYLKLLLQYYFQHNDLSNLKKVLLLGIKFDMTFEDVKEAFINIKSGDENVIEFMEDDVVFIKDSVNEEILKEMYEYYISDESNKVNLEQALFLIKKNRYICSFCYKNQEVEYIKFFLNENLLESLRRDLPYLFD